MKVLWAPWRMTLLSAGKQRRCIFCDHPRARDARQSLVLAANRTTVVMLNKYPYNSPHLMVAPRRHVADLDRLTRAQRIDLAETVRVAAGIVERKYRPEGLNIGMNLGRAAGAGIDGHLHWHIVPRWNGDTNFMPVIGSVKVIPQHLLETFDILHPGFAALRRRSRKRR